MNTTDRPFLTAADIAALWTAERQDQENTTARAEGRAPREIAPMSPNTVRMYHLWSSPPLNPAAATRRNRYEDNPMPAATYVDRQRPVWIPEPGESIEDLKRRLVQWFNDRPGPGVGGGAGTHRSRRGGAR